MATAKIKITAENAQALSGIKGVKGAISGIGSAIKTAFLPLAAIGGIAAIAGAGLRAIDKAGDFEQLQLGFETILKSASKAQKVIGDLRDFATKTPFVDDDVFAAARVLLPQFTEDTNQLGVVMRQLGDLASGAKQPIQDLALIINKGLNTGKLQGEILGQFAERNIPMIQELAKMYGVTTGEILKMGSAGKLTSKDMMAVLEAMTTGEGMYAGMADKLSTTFKGLISTLKGVLDNVLIEFGLPVIEALKPIITKLITGVEGLKPIARQWGETVAKWVNGANIFISAIQQGKAWDIIKLSIEQALATGAGFVMSALMSAWAGLAKIFDNVISELTRVFMGASWAMQASIERGLGMDSAYAENQAAGYDNYKRDAMMGVDSAIKNAFNAENMFTLLADNIKAERKKLIDQIVKTDDTDTATAGKGENPITKWFNKTMSDAINFEAPKIAKSTGIDLPELRQSSLVGVGGARGLRLDTMVTPMVREQQTTNQKMDKLIDAVKDISGMNALYA